MGFFWHSKPQKNTPENDENRLIFIENRLKKLENEVLGLAAGQEVIRNKVLKKIQFKRPDEETEEKPKDLYSGMLLPDR